jgi:hypothetical protein
MPVDSGTGWQRRRRQHVMALGMVVTLAFAAVGVASPAAGASSPFLGGLHHISTVASTVPANGDVNPYGVAVVPVTIGLLHQGDVLVSNFNDMGNQQGTGQTIMAITPGGQQSVFADIDLDSWRCPGGVGLTTALAVFSRGWVVVGSLPTTDGTAATAKAGCLFVLGPDGSVRATISGGPINGPWDMAAVDHGARGMLFVTNVLNGTVAANGAVVNRGTVVRIGLNLPDPFKRQSPTVTEETVIGSGFSQRSDPAALVVGPTGVGVSHGVLYVADTAANRISAIPGALTRTNSAGTGLDVTANGSLKGPLGLAMAPNGDILTVNAGNGRIVETTPAGAQAAAKLLDSTGTPPGNGTLFGLAVAPGGQSLYFVDDGTNTLNLLS